MLHYLIRNITIIISSLLFSLIIFKIYIKSSRKVNTIVDNPNNKSHSFHNEPVPTSGGVILFFIVFIFSYIFFCLKNSLECKVYLTWLIFLFCIIFGYLDDKKNIRARYKLLFQCFIGILVFILFKPKSVDIGLLQLSMAKTGLFYTIFYTILVMNALNFIDGLDGILASFVFLYIFFGFIIYNPSQTLSFHLLVWGSSILGFLFYNFHPARIFLGNSGSNLLGAFIVVTSLRLGSSGENLYKVYPTLILLALPITDLTGAFFRRVLKGKSPFYPDTEHLHHQMLKKFKDVKYVFLIFIIIESILGIIAYSTKDSSRLIKSLVYLFLFIIYIFTLFSLWFKKSTSECNRKDLSH